MAALAGAASDPARAAAARAAAVSRKADAGNARPYGACVSCLLSCRGSKRLFCQIQQMGVQKHDAVSGVFDRFSESVEETAPVRLRQNDMIAVRADERYIFLRVEFALSIIPAFFKAGKAVQRRVRVGKAALLVHIRSLRLEIRGIDLLDSVVQRLVRRFVVALRAHHRQRPARLEQVEGFGERDALGNPLDGRRGINHIECLIDRVGSLSNCCGRWGWNYIIIM